MIFPLRRNGAVTPKSVIGLSVLFLSLALILGFLNGQKVKALRANVGNADAAEHGRVTRERELKTREMAVATEEAKIAEAEDRVAKVRAELAQLQKEKADLQTTLEARQNEIASLQKRIEEAGTTVKPSENPVSPSATEQQLTAPPPSLEIKPERVEETTPPPKRPPREKTAPIKAPQNAGQPSTMSISSAKALAVSAPAPQYPPNALSRKISGSGVCVLSVDPGSGTVTEVSMAQSTGDRQLDKAALTTFRRWRFKRGTVSTVRIPIEFRP